MNTRNTCLLRCLALTCLGCLLPLALNAVPAQQGSELPALQALADQTPALPLKASFAKDPSGKNEAPIILQLKNESSQTVKVSGHIDLSVVVHNRPKSRSVAEQTIAAGAVLTIENLAPEDKVTLAAEGFAPLIVAVPYVK